MNVKELQEYRTKLYSDLYSNIIPDRVPVQDSLSLEFLIQYAGKDLMTTQYNYTDEILEEIYNKAGEELLRGDNLSAGFARNAVGLMFEMSIKDMMGASGFIQHPERCYMEPDEYDEYTKNPYDFFLEKIAPRSCRQLAKDGAFRSRAMLMSQMSAMDQRQMFGKINAKLIEKYGFTTTPPGSNSVVQPPFDLIADFARGFSQINMDIRRCPEKLKEAMTATMPYLLKWGSPAKPNNLGAAQIMTHMPAFLSLKQYEEFYHPTFSDLHHIYAEKGIMIRDFLEGDWTRFIDVLEELPMGTRLYMEFGDMQQFKNKLGKKMVLGGFYPTIITRVGTKDECIDKAKEILDVMAPNGNYFFQMNKSALSKNDIIPENYVAVMEYVRENSHYDNAGQYVTTEMKQEDTIKKGIGDKYPKFHSKYAPSFEEYLEEYPAADEKAIPYMKAAYEKYMSRIGIERCF